MAAATMIFSAIPVLRATRRQIRVLTVDEHQLVQEGLAAMINREEDMTVVAVDAVDDATELMVLASYVGVINLSACQTST